jgi:two-component system nitrogen regulation response regulator NtrX
MLSDQVYSLNPPDGEPLIAASAAMRRVLEQVRAAIEQPGHVFISGELGSGRETVARAIHQGIVRPAKNEAQFIKVDCARNPPQDLEKLLFATAGNGSETGVERRTLERVRPESALFQSLGGTLFLQNVGDLSARTQGRLARVLRDGEVVIMDEGRCVQLDHRVMTAGDVSVDIAATDGRILPDLHRRLCAFRVDVPPLRERREDIPALALHFVRLLCARASMPCKELTDSAQSMLAALPWKRGNSTELCSLLENLVLRTTAPSIGLEDVLSMVQLEAQAAWFPVGFSLRDARARFEREYIAAVLAQHHGRVPDAARTLGIQRSNLYRKMRHLNVPPKKRH